MLQGSPGLDGAASSFAGTLELRCAVQSPEKESLCLWVRGRYGEVANHRARDVQPLGRRSH